MEGLRPLVGPWVAFAAAAWAAVFAVFHIIWAVGWYPLLDAEQARIAFAVPWKWWYDVLVAVMCVTAVPVALASVSTWTGRLPWRVVHALACFGTTLLVLRSSASLVQTGYFIAVGRFRFALMGVWDWWFHVGAILFVLSTWRFRRMVRGRGEERKMPERRLRA